MMNNKNSKISPKTIVTFLKHIGSSHLESAIFIFGLAYQGKDIVFRFMIEYSNLMDFSP
jgi:hypothetical protein